MKPLRSTRTKKLLPVLFTLALCGRTAASPADSTDTNLRPPGPELSLYTEFYNSVDQAKKDIQIQTLTTEFAYRFSRPSLRPLVVGAMVSLYDTSGTLHPNDQPTLALPAATRGASAGLMMRFYAFETPRVSVFVDASASLVRFQDDFPPGGTKTNGVPRFGLGAQTRLSESWSLIAGVRWMHVSNGSGLVDSNPGIDSNGGYLGLTYRPGGRLHDAALARAMTFPESSTANHSTGLVYSYTPGNFPEARDFALHSIAGEYEWRPSPVGWLGLTAALSMHRATGDLVDPNHGLGNANPGSVGFGWHFGLRPQWEVNEHFGLYAEASYGGVRFNRSWPLNASAGSFIRPWSWSATVTYGGGVRWTFSDRHMLMIGWRHSQIDTSDERPGDATDFQGNGIVLGLQRQF